MCEVQIACLIRFALCGGGPPLCVRVTGAVERRAARPRAYIYSGLWTFDPSSRAELPACRVLPISASLSFQPSCPVCAALHTTSRLGDSFRALRATPGLYTLHVYPIHKTVSPARPGRGFHRPCAARPADESYSSIEQLM